MAQFFGVVGKEPAPIEKSGMEALQYINLLPSETKMKLVDTLRAEDEAVVADALLQFFADGFAKDIGTAP